MATLSQWVEGARPRTLPAAVAPVLVGTGAAYALGSGDSAYALLALLVSLALQVGVNYANDYSDGIRGTDQDRVGPVRLVGQQLARPGDVKAAAMICFATAAVIGLALVALSGAFVMLHGRAAPATICFATAAVIGLVMVALSGAFVLLLVGAALILAAW